MNPEEKEKQEKTLAKLQWLNERTKPDFKGNPSPFETKKTLGSVEQQKKTKARALAGDTDFLPFWHGTTPLALDATRCDYIKVGETPQCAPQRPSYGAQAIDPVTGMTEVQLALSWSVPHAAPSAPFRTRSSHTDRHQLPPKVARDAPYLRSLAPTERAAAFRQQILEHPKCTLEGTQAHQERWRNSTQLGDPVARPTRPAHNAALNRRNSVRAVHLLRST